MTCSAAISRSLRIAVATQCANTGLRGVGRRAIAGGSGSGSSRVLRGLVVIATVFSHDENEEGGF